MIYLKCNIAILLLDIYPKEIKTYIYTKKCKHVFTYMFCINYVYTKDYKLHDSIYIKFSKRQDYSYRNQRLLRVEGGCGD